MHSKLATAGSILILLTAACERDTARFGRADPTISQATSDLTDRWSPLIKFHDGDAADKSWGSPTHMTLLPDGRIVAFAQFMRTPLDEATTKYFRSFVFTPPPEPTTDTELAVMLPNEARRVPQDVLFCSGHTLTEDGVLFQAGGTRQLASYSGLNYARSYDAGADTWIDVTGTMPGGNRWYPALTRLPPAAPGDRAPILITGGYALMAGSPNPSVDLYDFETATYRSLAAAGPSGILGDFESDYSLVHLLPNPSVAAEMLMIGGTGLVYGFNYSNPSLDGASRFQLLAQRAGAAMQGASSVLLPLRNDASERGRILLIGGSDDPAQLTRIDLYDVAGDTWQSTAMNIERHHPSTVLLPDGKVLILAGHRVPESAGFEPNAATIFDPEALSVWDGTPSGDATLRGYHNAALLLSDGRVLLGSGRSYVYPGHSERNDARYYYPPYLDSSIVADRPVIVRAPAQMAYGEGYQIEFDATPGPINRVVLAALGSSTHAFDFNQRQIVLFTGTSTGSSIVVQTPISATIAPPGYYMLFVLRDVGGTLVPSVAQVIALAVDAAAPAPCGDGLCAVGETCTSCPGDCGTCTPSGPVGYWKLDDGSGRAAVDSSAFDNDGTLLNGPTWTNDAKFGGALQLDGNDAYVRVPDSALLSPTRVTVAAWVKLLVTTNNGGIVGHRATSSSNYAWRLEIEGSGNLAWGCSTTGTSAVNITTAPPTLNQWRFIAGTFDGSTVALYVDGTLAASAPLSGNLFDSSADVLIGRANDGMTGGAWPGILDEVRIYDRALTASEIAALAVATCSQGDMRSCYTGPSGTEDVGVCNAGVQSCIAGAWGTCAGDETPLDEACDGLDNDCDGDTDEDWLTLGQTCGDQGGENPGDDSGDRRRASGVNGGCATASTSFSPLLLVLAATLLLRRRSA